MVGVFWVHHGQGWSDNQTEGERVSEEDSGGISAVSGDGDPVSDSGVEAEAEGEQYH